MPYEEVRYKVSGQVSKAVNASSFEDAARRFYYALREGRERFELVGPTIVVQELTKSVEFTEAEVEELLRK